MKYAALSFLLVIPFSYAESYSEKYMSCVDNSNGVTIELIDCISDETIYQDKRLNIAYKKVMQSLNLKDSQALRAKQRSWIKARDEKVNSVIGDGTSHQLNTMSVFLDETMNRAEELESFLKR